MKITNFIVVFLIAESLLVVQKWSLSMWLKPALIKFVSTTKNSPVQHKTLFFLNLNLHEMTFDWGDTIGLTAVVISL